MKTPPDAEAPVLANEVTTAEPPPDATSMNAALVPMPLFACRYTAVPVTTLPTATVLVIVSAARKSIKLAAPT